MGRAPCSSARGCPKGGRRPGTTPGFAELLREDDFPGGTRPWGHCRRSGRVHNYPLRGCEGAFSPATSLRDAAWGAAGATSLQHPLFGWS